jgi:hypothetical protein
VFTRSSLGLELHVGNNEEANGATPLVGDGSSFLHRHHPFASEQERTRLRELGELGYMEYRQSLAVEWIRSHPLRFASLTLKRAQLYWFTGLEQREPHDRWRIPKLLLYVALGLGALAGLAALFWNGVTYRWLLLTAMLGPGLPYVLTHVSLRYRYPLYPLTLLMTCVAIAQAMRIWKGHAR